MKMNTMKKHVLRLDRGGLWHISDAGLSCHHQLYHDPIAVVLCIRIVYIISQIQYMLHGCGYNYIRCCLTT